MNPLEKVLQSKTMERTRRFLGKNSGLYLKLKRFTPSASEDLRTAALLNHMGINQVIDIGANTGQFAESLYDFDYTGQVVSFEPVESAYKLLEKRSQPYTNWQIAERCAIGDQDGEIEINVCDDSVFSSILPIKDSYVSHNPKSKIVRQERIPVFTLDTIVSKYVDLDQSNILLKVDTQGYEKQVLDGAVTTLPKVKGLKIEIPLYPIYDNTEFTFYDIIEFMKVNGFEPYSFNIEGVDLTTGRVNTIDGLFFKAD